MSKLNRNFKASVFTHLFSDPEREFELYNAIAPGTFPQGTPVRDVTLRDALFMDRVNDLSFVVGDKLVVFFEHQGSINENLPLRYLVYCGRVYETIIPNTAMYSERRVQIPTPEFYVLYNGRKPYPEKTVHRLSDSFALPPQGEPALDLVVHVYNVNKGFNAEIVKRSETLSGYVSLVSKAREHEAGGISRAEAVKLAINECKESGILAEYLEQYASEVSNMLLQEWDWDIARAVWEKEAEERAKEEERSKWQSIVADKDATIAKLQAQLTPPQ